MTKNVARPARLFFSTHGVQDLPRRDVVIGTGILFVAVFALCCAIGIRVGWVFRAPRFEQKLGQAQMPAEPLKPVSIPQQQEVEIRVVAVLEVAGCEYLVFSTGQICHKGDCKACREWLLQALAAQSAMENRDYEQVPGGTSER